MSEPGKAAVVDDDALLGFIPPSWKPGSSWVLEQWTWHYQGLARVRPRQQERYAEVYFRVERVDENEAVLSALATEPAGAEDAATIRVRLRPFHAASFAAGTHFPFSSVSLNDPSTDYLEDFLIRFPAAPSRDVAPRDLEAHWTLADGEARYVWSDPDERHLRRHVVTWRRGDPWWSRHEVLGPDGKTARRSPPGPDGGYIPESEYVYLSRARLIVVDGQVITPMPWSD